MPAGIRTGVGRSRPGGRGVDTVAELLRADVANEMRRGVRVTIGVAIQAGHTSAGSLGASVLGLVELLLGEGGDQQAESFQLLGVQEPVEQLVVIVNGHQIAPGHVAEIGAGGQKMGAGNSGST
jgi:hypothetical protein